MRDAPVIRQEGFEVVGTEFGGWIIMTNRQVFEPRSQFIAAFTTFDEMLAWLGRQSRHDTMASLAQDGGGD